MLHRGVDPAGSMSGRKLNTPKSDDSTDFCTISEDVGRLNTPQDQELDNPEAQHLAQHLDNSQQLASHQASGFQNWGGNRGIEPWQANLLSEEFKNRLKQTLEHFTKQQQDLAQRARPEGRPPPPPSHEDSDPEASRSRAFQSPVASLATMGPAARELAHMIQASQQRQQHFEHAPHAPYWQSEEERGQVHNPWLAFSNPKQYHDYWQRRAPANRPFFSWEQPPQPPQSAPALLPRPDASSAAWGPRNGPIPALPTLPQLPHPDAAGLDPRSQAELQQSVQMLQEAQRMSAFASSRINDLYQNATSRKRKADEEEDGKPLNVVPPLLPNPAVGASMVAQHLPALQNLFPPPEAEQKCSVCGTQTTPVWRRIDKQLVCNACGLRKRRSAKKKQDARQERRPKMPMAPLSLAYDPSMPHMEPEPEHEPHVHEEEQIQNDMPEQE